MADQLDDQDQYGGLAQDLLGKMGMPQAQPQGLGRDLLQALPLLMRQPPVLPAVLPVQSTSITYVPSAVANNAPAQAAGIGSAPNDAGNQVIRDQAKQDAIYASQPDLGFMGNTARSMLQAGFPQALFSNYWKAKGPYALSDARFDDIVNTAGKLKPSSGPVAVTAPDGTPLVRRQYSFYGLPEYEKALGTASLFYGSDGKPAGFNDDYNFDNTPGKNRGPLSRLEIWGMSKLGPRFGARGFPVYYGEYAPTN